MNYCYRVKSKWLKTRADGSRDIEEYFHKYVEQEGVEEIYAIPYRLVPESSLVRGDVSLLNDPKWQASVKIEQHIDDFAKEGLLFTEILNQDGTKTYLLQEDEETLKDFEMCRLCVDLIDNDTHGYLFILRSDGHTMYFNANVIKSNMPEIIETLLEKDVIYKTVAPGDKVRKNRKKAGKA